MDKFIIKGGKALHGSVKISGAKNASLALIPATILASGVAHLGNTPRLRDTITMQRLIENLGVQTSFDGDVLTVDTSTLSSFEAPYEHVKKMRASIYVLGPLLARYQQARVSLPGGCAWGPRPINLHLKAMEAFGAKISLDAGYIIAKASNGLHGAAINFEISSVGATGNALMVAVLARGETTLSNAAIEPEITSLAKYLVAMGAHIEGIGTTTLRIQGVDTLTATDVDTIPDRIEAGTFLVAAAITGGSVRIENCEPLHIEAITEKLQQAGCELTIDKNTIDLTAPGSLHPVDVTTGVYPEFPTDMQAQWIALMCFADGTSTVTDTVYRDRFAHVSELSRLGAQIRVHDNGAHIRGNGGLHGAKVMSTDLRASASLVLAALRANGTTEVLRIYHLDRGYEAMEKKFVALGADISRVSGDEF